MVEFLNMLSTWSLSLQQHARVLYTVLWQPSMAWWLVVWGLVAGAILRFAPWYSVVVGMTQLWAGRSNTAFLAPHAAFTRGLFSLSFMLGVMQLSAARVIQTAGPSAIVWMLLAALPAMAIHAFELQLSTPDLGDAPHAKKTTAANKPVRMRFQLSMMRMLPLLGEKWRWLGKVYAGLGLLGGLCLGALAQAQIVTQGLAHLPVLLPWMVGAGLALCIAPCLFVRTPTLIRWCAGLTLGSCILFLSIVAIALLTRITLLPQRIYVLGKGVFAAVESSSKMAGASWTAMAAYGLMVGFSAVLAGLGVTASMRSGNAHAPPTLPSGRPPHTATFAASHALIAPFYLLCFGLGSALVMLGSHFWLQHQSPLQTMLEGFEYALPTLGRTACLVALGMGALAAILAWSLFVKNCLQQLFGAMVGLWLLRIIWPLALLAGSTLSHLQFLPLSLALAVPWLVFYMACATWAGIGLLYRRHLAQAH